jgi:hypothetical protein
MAIGKMTISVLVELSAGRKPHCWLYEGGALFRKWKGKEYLHCHKSIIDNHFLGQEVCANRGFVLGRKLLVYILIHQGCLSDPAHRPTRKFKILQEIYSETMIICGADPAKVAPDGYRA